MSESIKLSNARLDEEGNEIVIRGAIDPLSLAKLKVARYQREVLDPSTIHRLTTALREGVLPDICLGMRGERFRERDGEFILENDVYIIDGLQRRTAALDILRAGETPHLGAMVFLNTSEAMERAKFRGLNLFQNKLSPNVTLRNEAHDNEFVAMLYDLCLDPTFALHGRVCWNQRMKRSELLTAIGMLKISARLHARFTQGRSEWSSQAMALKMAGMMRQITRRVVRENIKTYWQTIDDAFGIKKVTYKEGAGFLRHAFNAVLSLVMADHQDFWMDAQLTVPRDLKRKLSLFPITDPHIAALSAASLGGPANSILYEYIVRHLNSGKRTRRMRPFVPKPAPAAEMEVEEDEMAVTV